MSQVRVRFAPSPTGFFHLGSARTALFNWLYARHTGGCFVLRIEDTDEERNTPEALATLLDGMRWLGLDWDEGPEAGGTLGPYFQSQRQAIYETWLQKLFKLDRAYEKDGATFFRLTGERYVAFDSYKNASLEKVRNEPVVIEDAIRGRVEKTVEQDFVIRRSNGAFSFHFVNVVDDIMMQISHVIRGEDHLSNTARHIELYRAFAITPPVFAHIPLILRGDGQGKMSKRHSGALIEVYRQKHFLPEAVRNFLCLLGWNPKGTSEIMPISTIIERFDFGGIQKDGAKFDEAKLAYMNTEYLRALNLETFTWIATPILAEAGFIHQDLNEDDLQAVLSIAQPKARDLEGLPQLVGFFFNDDFVIDPKAREQVFKKGNPVERLAEAITALETIDEWTQANLKEALEHLAQVHELKVFAYFPILRLATSGQAGGPELLSLLTILGQRRVITRSKAFLDNKV